MIKHYMQLLNIDTDFYCPEKISEQYQEWYRYISEKTGLDPSELYRMANQTEGEVVVHYLATRAGCGFGFWDKSSWQFHDILYHAAIKQGRLE
jgi:hypothetical protein